MKEMNEEQPVISGAEITAVGGGDLIVTRNGTRVYDPATGRAYSYSHNLSAEVVTVEWVNEGPNGQPVPRSRVLEQGEDARNFWRQLMVLAGQDDEAAGESK